MLRRIKDDVDRFPPNRPASLFREGRPMSLKSIAHKLSEWRRYRISVRELTRLSDRELADLGMSRAEIGHVARKAASI